ncbi:endolytic transglycosylase MltG [Rhodobacter calidifons]|uniref:Endolytic murein transglycosylase n=1 Tax=Rhodobacter calidifons TaxID=2715277 RepID=A0ABX0G9G1_9RHOB|nr:endolytic transglycosylase MltG [Rhodobacter calidifons]NHB77945.1 endolytic transglycosylase MltG [Rhodobacter calidifons]
MWRSIASNALTLFIVILIGMAALVAWGRNEFFAAGPLQQPICLEVERGASLSAVSRTLEQRGAISDARIFRIGAEYADLAGDLKFGSYKLPAGASMAQVLEAITTSGRSTCGRDLNFRIGVTRADVVLSELDLATNSYAEVVRFDAGATPLPPEYLEVSDDPALTLRITVAEGVTSWQIVDALKKADFLQGALETVPPEGSLAPGGYEVERGTQRAAVIASMTAKQAAILAAAWEARAPDLPYDTPQEALIMASIIEKETGVPEERGRVASVFVNRLRQGMRLQTDPTVIYGITRGEGVLGRGLRQSELRRETPYNTYVINGLPPTPIANPGAEAIRAAVNPDKTDYLFFVADGTGGHAFAATLEEHNRNVAAWRKIEAAQGATEEGGVQGE